MVEILEEALRCTLSKPPRDCNIVSTRAPLTRQAMSPANRARRPGRQQSKETSAAALQAKNTANPPAISPLRLHALPLGMQQVIINVFNTAFPITQSVENWTRVVQEVKMHLYNRDFSSAFGQPAYLQAYASRWSAARALGYCHILTHPDRAFLLTRHPAACVSQDDEQGKSLTTNPGPRATGTQFRPTSNENMLTNVVCLGGGAGAEVVAIAAAHRQLGIGWPLNIVTVDSADWSDPLRKLSLALTTAPALTPHASEAVKAKVENQALVDNASNLMVSFVHQDILSWDVESISRTVDNASLCTIMFTLNELFSVSLPKTTSFLLNLTTAMPDGSHLLVVDSPGSYSEIQLGRSSKSERHGGEQQTTAIKKYPMKWLLDHTLLEVAGSNDDAQWKKVRSEDSSWFRLDQKEKDRLRYPVELENMRYQLHLYRRIKSRP